LVDAGAGKYRTEDKHYNILSVFCVFFLGCVVLSRILRHSAKKRGGPVYSTSPHKALQEQANSCHTRKKSACFGL